MIGLIANIIGWVATVFRGAGMLMKRAMLVKYLVSIGNLLWMVNGILTHNAPLIASNALCLVIMLYEIIITNIRSKKE
jgi:hypothetical protein